MMCKFDEKRKIIIEYHIREQRKYLVLPTRSPWHAKIKFKSDWIYQLEEDFKKKKIPI